MRCFSFTYFLLKSTICQSHDILKLDGLESWHGEGRISHGVGIPMYLNALIGCVDSKFLQKQAGVIKDAQAIHVSANYSLRSLLGHLVTKDSISPEHVFLLSALFSHFG